MNRNIARALIAAAYEHGWRDACDDFLAQDRDSSHPIGRGKRGEVEVLLADLDPHNLLGLR